jgi:hypothetical protein
MRSCYYPPVSWIVKIGCFAFSGGVAARPRPSPEYEHEDRTGTSWPVRRGNVYPGCTRFRQGKEPDMSADADQRPARRKLFPTVLHVLLAIYGILYLVFIIIGFIPSPEGSPVSDSVPYHPFGLDGSLAKVLFAFFLVGFFTAWRNRLAGGVLFLFWWVGMWGFEILMVSRGRSGGAVAMGAPLFVLGVLFIISGYRQRRSRTAPSQS